MATNKNRKSKDTSNQGALSELDKFLTKFVELTSQVPKGMLAQTTDADEIELIAAYAGPLNEQVTQLSEYLRQKSQGASRQALEQAGTVLRLMAADSLTDSGMRVARNLSSQKAKIGLSDIIDLIKKIIRALAQIFHITLPDWFEPLLELIDEIINFLLSIGLIKLASTLSKRHQDYMAELTHLERLQRASAWRNQNAEEEEE
jgi:uncharacterized phage infection (PIP) family protein YhgE